MEIRIADTKDIDGITRLLYQVHGVHAEGRPDLFKKGGIKYNKSELLKILEDENRIIFIATSENNSVLGYIFCVFEETNPESTCEQHIRTLYVDDLCIDENCRGQKIGQKLYAHAVEYAKKNDFYRITLHVWECNSSAKKFYEKLGLKPLYTAMEQIL